MYNRQLQRWEERRDAPLCRTCQWSRPEGRQRCGMEPERRETGAQRAAQSWLDGLGDGPCPCYAPKPIV